MKRRDSCRDYLCHLYAYASLSPESWVFIRSFLQKENITEGILEHGAGSGYLAKILETHQVPIRAYDVCPTSASDSQKNNSFSETMPSNDNHGLTPPFYTDPTWRC